jgi:hypothetical protein
LNLKKWHSRILDLDMAGLVYGKSPTNTKPHCEYNKQIYLSPKSKNSIAIPHRMKIQILIILVR